MLRLLEAKDLRATEAPALFKCDSTDKTAWKTVPSWYLVSQEDQTIYPEMERFMAKRIGAQTSEIKASHVAFISHPQEVVQLLESTAAATTR